MDRQIVSTTKAPAAIGPYSQAVKSGSMVFTSGQIALHPESGQLVQDSLAAETRQVLSNLSEVLLAAGSSLSHALKVNVYVTDMSRFAELNEIYQEYFPEDPPARATVEVSKLPADASVEMDAVALVK